MVVLLHLQQATSAIDIGDDKGKHVLAA